MAFPGIDVSEPPKAAKAPVVPNEINAQIADLTNRAQVIQELPMLLARVVLLLGLLLLKWAKSTGDQKPSVTVIKLGIIAGFLCLYPIYFILAIIGGGIFYAASGLDSKQLAESSL